jgi:hypothetical protein
MLRTGHFIVRDLTLGRAEACFTSCSCPLSDLTVLDHSTVVLASWCGACCVLRPVGQSTHYAPRRARWAGAVRMLDLRTKTIIHEFELPDHMPAR